MLIRVIAGISLLFLFIKLMITLKLIPGWKAEFKNTSETHFQLLFEKINCDNLVNQTFHGDLRLCNFSSSPSMPFKIPIEHCDFNQVILLLICVVVIVIANQRGTVWRTLSEV